MKKELNTEVDNVIEDIHTKSATLNFELIKNLDTQETEEMLQILLDNYDLDEVYRESFVGLSYMVTNALKELVINGLEFKNTNVYRVSMLLDENLTKQLIDPVNSLINHHTKGNTQNTTDDRLIALLTAYKCLELEDEVKRLTLTKEQYTNWLSTDVQRITTKQFEVLYGINLRKQAQLRSRIQNPLPSYKDKELGNKHLYDKAEVDVWLSNYKR